MFQELGLCAAGDFSSLVDDSGEFGFASHSQVTKPGQNVEG